MLSKMSVADFRKSKVNIIFFGRGGGGLVRMPWMFPLLETIVAGLTGGNGSIYVP
jgi:hypothetical protein